MPIPAIDPRRTALLVLDVEPFVLRPIGDADRLLDTLEATVAAARAGGLELVFVRVAFADADYPSIPATNKALAPLIHMAAHKPMHADHPATAVHPRLIAQPGDLEIRKTRVSAFAGTDLDARLRAAGIDTLILAGVPTSGAVLSTERDAADRDYRVFVLADATADADPEVHDLLIKKVFPVHAHVITTAELTALLPSITSPA
jgi:nicotinamidase-related amidase